MAIKNFRHKGLERFFGTGSKAGIQAKHADRLRLILGRLSVATGDHAPPQPRFDMMARAGAAPAASPPVAVEGGTTELTVTVTGDAVLDRPTGR